MKEIVEKDLVKESIDSKSKAKNIDNQHSLHLNFNSFSYLFFCWN